MSASISRRRTSAGQRVAATILGDIKAGRRKAGDRLPAEAELQQTFDVGRTAVRSALQILREQGYVVTARGSGSIVATPDSGAQSGMSISKQIARDLRGDITSGRREAGEQLPTVAEIATTYGVSAPLVIAALRPLTDEGLIYSRGRNGRFVGPADAPMRRRVPTKVETVAAAIAKHIRAGRYLPGEFLLSESEMQDRYGVSLKTARGAVALLRAQGWARTVPQRGTFVSEVNDWPKVL